MPRNQGTSSYSTCAAILLTIALPALAAAPASAGLWDGAVEAFRHLINGGEHRTHIQWSDRASGSTVEFDLHGEVEFSADDRDVASLTPGGELELELREPGVVRKVRIRADRSGGLERSWSKGDGWLAWDAEAAEWFASVLPDLIRDSGIGAEGRVERILAAQGVGGVLDEVALIRGDWARAVYLIALIDRAELQVDEQVRALAALRGGQSDYEKARVLRYPDWLDLEDDAVRRSFLATAATIESDYESRLVLGKLLASPDLAGEAIDEILRLAVAISSDYEKATVLLAIAPAHLGTPERVSAYLEAAASIDSDYELRRVMSSLLSQKRLSPEDTARALAAVGGIDSDYEKATLLVDTAKGQDLAAAAQEAYLRAAESIGAAYEKRRALLALLDAADLESAGLARLARAAASISADYEKVSVLQRLAAAPALRGEAQVEFVRAVASVGSGHERQRALTAFLSAGEPEGETLFAVLRLVATFSSDSEKAAVLTRIAPRVDSEELEAAYLEVVETLHSDTDYRSAMRALRADGVRPRRASG